MDAIKDTVSITSVTNPIGLASQASVTVAGKGEPGATITVIADDNVTSTDPKTATVAADGTWTSRASTSPA